MSGKRDRVKESADLSASGEKPFNLKETLAFLQRAKTLVEKAKENDGKVDAQEAAEIFTILLGDLDPVRGEQVKGKLLQAKRSYDKVCTMLDEVPVVRAYIHKNFPAFFTVFSSDVREVSSDDDVQAPAPAKLSSAKIVTSRASGAKITVPRARKEVPARKKAASKIEDVEGAKSLPVIEPFPLDGQPSAVEQQERDIQERTLLEEFMGLDDGSSSGQEPDSRLTDSQYVEEIARILVSAQADAAKSIDEIYQAARAIFIQRFLEQTPEEYLAGMEDRRVTEKNPVFDADEGVRDIAAVGTGKEEKAGTHKGEGGVVLAEGGGEAAPASDVRDTVVDAPAEPRLPGSGDQVDFDRLSAVEAYVQRALDEPVPTFEPLVSDRELPEYAAAAGSRQEDARVDDPDEALPELEPTPLSREDELRERAKNIDRILTELSKKDFWEGDVQLSEGIVRLADLTSDEERKRVLRQEMRVAFLQNSPFEDFLYVQAKDKDRLYTHIKEISRLLEGILHEEKFEVLGLAPERSDDRAQEVRGARDSRALVVSKGPTTESRLIDGERVIFPAQRPEPGPASLPGAFLQILSSNPQTGGRDSSSVPAPSGSVASFPRSVQKESLFTRAKKWAHGKHEELAASSDVYRAHVMGALTEKEAREQTPTLSYKAMIAGGLVSGMLTRFGVAFPVDAIRYVTQRHFTGIEREEITQAFQAALAERRAERQEGEDEDLELRNESLRRRVASSRYLTHAKKEELMRELEQQLVFFSTGENKIYDAQYTGGEVGRLLDHEIRTRVSGEKVAKEFVNTSLKGGALVATVFGAAPLAALGYQFLRAPSYGAISVYGRWHRLTRENPESPSGERLKAAFVGGFTEWFDGARGKKGRLSQAAAFGTAARFAGIGSTFVEAAVSSGAIDSLLSAWEDHEFTFPEDLRNLFSGGVDRVEAYVSSLASGAEERVSSFAEWVKESASSSYDRAHEQVTSALHETRDRVSSFTEESSSAAASPDVVPSVSHTHDFEPAVPESSPVTELTPEPAIDNVPDAVVATSEPIVSSVINPESIPHEAILGRGDGITQVLQHAVEADHNLLQSSDQGVLTDDLQKGLFMRRLAAREGLLDYWLSDKAVGQLAIIPQYEGETAHIAFLNPQTGQSYSIAELKKLGWLIKAVKK